jgi:hypothetical protein
MEHEPSTKPRERTEEDCLAIIKSIIDERLDPEKGDPEELARIVNDMRVNESSSTTFIKIDMENMLITEDALEEFFYGDPSDTSVLKLIDDKLPDGFYPSYEVDEDAIYINIVTVMKKWSLPCVII